MKSKFYITTTLPYVNAPPHLGFALEIIQADVIARYQTLLGNEVFFNTGTDEHGQKIYQKAIEEGKNPQEYTDEYAQKFDILKDKLNLTYNNFIRTTDEHHKNAAQEIWRLCDKNGYIYKKNYKTKYCVGCELEKTDSELIDSKCPIHPNKDIEIIEEENYFFKFSDFSDRLLNLYEENPDFIIPSHRLTEMKKFVEGGLQDFSISRLKEKMPWGVAVPNDDKHVMYVWFDALTNYISALGWPEDGQKFTDLWGTKESPNAIQVAGKDNLRQQSSMWQAMLMAANLPPSRQIFIHGFITSGGAKMSKSLGNVVDPIEYVDRYGTDALRYYLLAKMSPTEDSDFTKEKFEEAYNGDLANGLGNLVSRVAKMAEKSGFDFHFDESIHRSINRNIENYRFDEELKNIWEEVSKTDQYISENEPWKLEGVKLKEVLENSINSIKHIADNLKPFLPETSEKILKIFNQEKIKASEPLFPRIK